MQVGWNNRLTTLEEGVLGEWISYVLLIHQLYNQTVWRVGWMKRLLLFDLHFGAIHSPFYTCLLALLVEKIFEVTPTSPKALTCWISQILNIHFTRIEYLWSVESENHTGPKKSIAARNRLFHGTLQLSSFSQRAREKSSLMSLVSEMSFSARSSIADSVVKYKHHKHYVTALQYLHCSGNHQTHF